MNLIERVKNIITNPNKEWDVINEETPNTQNILMTYVIPLVAIGTVASFIGWSFIGKSYSFGFGSFKVHGISLGLRYALVSLVGGLAGVFLAAFVIDTLAPNFKSEKNFDRSFQLCAYAFTPGWIGAVLNIIPSLATIGSLFGLYGLYLLYLGLPKLKKTPQEQTTSYYVVSLITVIVCSVVIGLVLGSILVGKNPGSANISF